MLTIVRVIVIFVLIRLYHAINDKIIRRKLSHG